MPRTRQRSSLLRALLAQLAPIPEEPAANVQRAVEIIADASVELVVFPELFLSGYNPARANSCALEANGPELGRVCTAAAQFGVAVAIGFPERRGNKIYNSLAVIDESGEMAAVYSKLQLFGEEREVFEPGEALEVAQVAGRKIGPLICFDMEFPELARALALAGADCLLTVAANPAPFRFDHRIAAHARALENRVPHLYCNRCGSEAGLNFVGESRAMTLDGKLEAEAGAGEALLCVSAALSGVSDERVDYLSQLPKDLRVNGPTLVAGGSR